MAARHPYEASTPTSEHPPNMDTTLGGIKSFFKRQDNNSDVLVTDEDARLAQLGYKNEFKREFGNLSTLSFALAIMGVTSSLISTYDTPYYSGGPSATVWCWLIGSIMCTFLAASIAELVSAYPTSGGLYSASAYLVPQRYKAPVGWTIGWLNLLGQIAGVASTEFGLSRQIWAAVVIAQGPDSDFTPSNGQLVGLYVGLLVFHGLINCLATKLISKLTLSFIFINLGGALAIWIGLGAAQYDKNDASYIFGTIINGSGYESTGLAFLFGLLSVQWTMTDYDATAHISEEVRKASVAAPVAIFMAVLTTGVIGFILNIVITMGAGPDLDLPGNSGLTAATVVFSRLGFGGGMFVWSLVLYTTSAVVISALQANARTAYALSRDGLLPDRGLLGKMAPNRVPVNAVFFVVAVSVVLGMLQFASAIALNAIFSLCAIALDTSYAVPIFCKLLFRNHPEVMFRPGPFTLGAGTFGKVVNVIAVSWVSLVTVILRFVASAAIEVTSRSFPVIYPVTAENMNYASVILVGVLFLSTVYWWAGARNHYTGPKNFTGGVAADQGLGHKIDQVRDSELPTHDTRSEEKQIF